MNFQSLLSLSYYLEPTPGGDFLLGYALLAFFMLIGSLGAAIAFQNGPPATIAAFDYSFLAFSILWGGLFFAEFPNMVGYVGVALIVFAGWLAFPRKPA